MTYSQFNTMTEVKQNAEVLQIFQDLLEQRNKSDVHMDDAVYKFNKIQKIDNILVEVVIMSRRVITLKEDKEMMTYTINSKDIHYDMNTYMNYVLYSSGWFDNKSKLDILLVEKLLNHLHENILKMKLDKVFGKLITKVDHEDFDDFINSDECCVCYEKTVTFTSCEHHLCIQCWDEMLQKHLKECPLCKRGMSVYVGEDGEY